MKSHRKKHKRNSGKSHVPKTKQEAYEYIEKVKSAHPLGDTGENEKADKGPAKLKDSDSSIELNTSSGDHKRIPRPDASKIDWGKWSFYLALILAIIGAIFFIAKNQIQTDDNAETILTIQSAQETYNKNLNDVKIRLARLEEWKELFSESIRKDIENINKDMQSGEPLTDIKNKLDNIESKIRLNEPVENDELIDNE